MSYHDRNSHNILGGGCTCTTFTSTATTSTRNNHSTTNDVCAGHDDRGASVPSLRVRLVLSGVCCPPGLRLVHT